MLIAPPIGTSIGICGDHHHVGSIATVVEHGEVAGNPTIIAQMHRHDAKDGHLTEVARGNQFIVVEA